MQRHNYTACNYNDRLPVTIRFANKVGDVQTMRHGSQRCWRPALNSAARVQAAPDLRRPTAQLLRE